MQDSLFALIVKSARNWLFLITATVFVYLAGVLGTELMGHAGGQPSFDLRMLGYSDQTATGYLQALSAEGKALYLHEVQRTDTIFPPLLMAALILLMLGLKGAMRLFWLMPIAYCACDLMENAAIRRILEGGLPVDTAEVAAASRLTVLKFALVLLSLLGAGLAVYGDWRSDRDAAGLGRRG